MQEMLDIGKELNNEEILVFELLRNSPKSITVEADIIVYLNDGSYHATRKIRLVKK